MRVGPRSVLRRANRFRAGRFGTKRPGLSRAKGFRIAGRYRAYGRLFNGNYYRRRSARFCAPRVFFGGDQMFSIIGAILKTVGELLLTFWTDFHSSLTSGGEY